jgi:hypothetical protein
MVFPSYEELLDAIGEVVTGIESETLTAVFEHWMDLLFSNVYQEPSC